MTTYTAADFEKATFARHPDGVTATRIYDSDTMPWITGDETWLNDAEMADEGDREGPVLKDGLHEGEETPDSSPPIPRN